MDSRISTGLHASVSDPEKSFDKKAKPEADRSESELRAELKRLLGSLVPALLRDAKGDLDLSRIPAKDFDEFKQLLAAHAALNDGKAFRNPYQKMFEGEEFRSLLRFLYQEKDPSQFVSLSVEEGRHQLDELTAALIDVDADAFVQRQLNTQEGLGRLRHVLGELESFTGDQRADVAKALGRARSDSEDRLYSYCIDQEISLWNFFNLGVEKKEVTRVSELAIELIEGLEDRLPTSNVVFRPLHGVEIALVEKYQKLTREKAADPNPVAQAQAALADLWLLTANPKLWSLQNQYGGLENRAHALKSIEALLTESESIQDESGFRAFNEKLLNFLEGAVTTEGDDAASWLNYRVLGIGMDQVYDNVDSVRRGPYQKITRLSSEWKYAAESGHTILSHLQSNTSDDKAVADDANRLILNLKETQRQLWYGYKQHKAISRLGSELVQIPYLIAKGVGAEESADYALGDFAQIDVADQEIGRIVAQLEKAKCPEDLAQELDKLHALLKPGSTLYTAYEAAEMDGSEQILGLAQTLAIIAATAAATRGASVVAGGGVVAARSIATVTWLDKAVKGFAWGAYIATAENAVAAGSGEVREGGETVEKWVKDAAATGGSMALTGPWMKAAAGSEAQSSTFKSLFARYTSNGFNGARHLVGDIAMETGEEIADQTMRQAMDGKTAAPSLAQLEEITKISLAGGGTKIGAIAQSMNQGKIEVKATLLNQTPTVASPSPLRLQRSLAFSPMWTMLGAGGLGGGSDGKMAKLEKSFFSLAPKLRLNALGRILSNIEDAAPDSGDFLFDFIQNVAPSLDAPDRLHFLKVLKGCFDHPNDFIRSRSLETFRLLATTIESGPLSEEYRGLEENVLHSDPDAFDSNLTALRELFPALDAEQRIESARRLKEHFSQIDPEIWSEEFGWMKEHLPPEFEATGVLGRIAQAKSIESLANESPEALAQEMAELPSSARLEQSIQLSEIARDASAEVQDFIFALIETLGEGIDVSDRMKLLKSLETFLDEGDSNMRSHALGAMSRLILTLSPDEMLKASYVLEAEVINTNGEDLITIIAFLEVFAQLEPEERFQQALRLESYFYFIKEEGTHWNRLLHWMGQQLSPEQWIALIHLQNDPARAEAARYQGAPQPWGPFIAFDKYKLNAIGAAGLAFDPLTQGWNGGSIASAALMCLSALVLGMVLKGKGESSAESPYRELPPLSPTLNAIHRIFSSSVSSVEQRLQAIEFFRDEILASPAPVIHRTGFARLLNFASKPDIPSGTQFIQSVTERESDRLRLRMAALDAALAISPRIQNDLEKLGQKPEKYKKEVRNYKEELVYDLAQFMKQAREDGDLERVFYGVKGSDHSIDINKGLRRSFLSILERLGFSEEPEFFEIHDFDFWRSKYIDRYAKTIGGSTLAYLSGAAITSALVPGGLALSTVGFGLSFTVSALAMGHFLAFGLRQWFLAYDSPVDPQIPARERSIPKAPTEIRIAEFGMEDSESKLEENADAELEATEVSAKSKKSPRLHSIAAAGAGTTIASLLSSGEAQAAASSLSSISVSDGAFIALFGAGLATLALGMANQDKQTKTDSPGPYREAAALIPTLRELERTMFNGSSSLEERLAAIDTFHQELRESQHPQMFQGINILLELAANPNVSIFQQLLQNATLPNTDRRSIRLAAMKAVADLSRIAGANFWQVQPHSTGQARATMASWASSLHHFLSAARADLELDILELGERPFLKDLNKPLREAFLTTLRNLGLQESSEFLELQNAKYWAPGLVRWSNALMPSTVGLLAGAYFLGSEAFALTAFAPIILFGLAAAAHSLRKSRLRQIFEAEGKKAGAEPSAEDVLETLLKPPNIRIEEFDIPDSKLEPEAQSNSELEAAETEVVAAEEEEGKSSKARNLLSIALAGAGTGIATLFASGSAEAATSISSKLIESQHPISNLSTLTFAAAGLGMLASIFLRLRSMLSHKEWGISLESVIREREAAINADPRLIKLHRDLHAPEASLRILAAEEAAKNESRELMADLISLLKDPEAGVREAAQVALAQLGTEEEISNAQKQREAEIEELRTYFYDPEPRMQELAASRAWIYRERSFIPELLGMVDDSDPKISNGVLASLALLANASDLPSLLFIVKSKPGAELEERLKQLVSYIVRHSPVSDLKGHFKDSDPFVRRNMIAAMMTRSDMEGLPLIVKSLQDPDPRIRVAAIEALQLVGNGGVLPEIKKRLADASPLVRFVAQIAVEVLSREEGDHPTQPPKPRDPRDLN